MKTDHALLCATFFGAGRLPKAPGTWGTLAAVPLAWLCQMFGDAVLAGVFILITGVGVWSAQVVVEVLKRKDPSEVVIDEVAGFLLTMMIAPRGWGWMVGGFLLFRLFDIWKPWPVHALERLPGGWGVMADDLAAGVWAGLCLLLIARIGSL
ncbi:MAG: phosphatidylglycerophosphatase A [Magnetococcales bacterium]|nr:phosphatidylglycerophosphatase A [Magnetococcales bacterium]NGZ05667.1 phosphatidylglycerophosphatase A [Magnetococcales bacterium]